MAPSRTSFKKRSLIYMVTLRDVDGGYVKLGKCTRSPWDRFRYGKLAKTITPRGYKKQVADDGNLKVLGCFTFPTKSDVDVHRIEQLFHKTHRETARCGEWYPARAVDLMRRFLVRCGGRPCRFRDRPLVKKKMPR